MMKKIFGTMFVLLTIFIAGGYGFDIGYVDIDFCDGSNAMHMSGEKASLEEFCFTLTNLSQQTGLVTIGLVDGEMTLGENPTQACKTSSDGFFGKFVSIDIPENIAISPSERISYTGTVSLPDGFVGSLYGCIILTIPDITEQTQMFTIVNRKANIMSIEVYGPYLNTVSITEPTQHPSILDINNKTTAIKTADNLSLFFFDKEKWELRPIVSLYNSGYIAEEYTIQGSVSVKLGPLIIYNKDFMIQGSGILYGGDTILLQDNTITIPWRTFGRLHGGIVIDHGPHNPSNLMSNIYNTHIDYSTTTLLYPHRYIIYGLGLIILVLIVIIYIRKRKHL